MSKITRHYILHTVSIVIYLAIVSCGQSANDECGSYSKYSCDEMKSATYNVYFYFPNDKEVKLGVANGLDECGSMAHKYANSKNISRESYSCGSTAT